MGSLKKIKELEAFIVQEVDLFAKMMQNTTIDVYTADPMGKCQDSKKRKR